MGELAMIRFNFVALMLFAGPVNVGCGGSSQPANSPTTASHLP